MLLNKADETLVRSLIGKTSINFDFSFDGKKLQLVSRPYKLTELECFGPEEDEDTINEPELEHHLTAENTCVPLGVFYPVNQTDFTKNCIIYHKKANGMPVASLNGWCCGQAQLDKIKTEFEIMANKKISAALAEMKEALAGYE
jgi:hypothetical protein